MSGLTYGLNITKKAANSKPSPARRKPIFGEDDDSEPDEEKSTSVMYGSLSTSLSTKKHDNEATALDPSIYDYDAFHVSQNAARSRSPPTKDRRPKYMTNLLAAAEVRKRDQLRAKEKMLAREREAEGDLYADKEKFVTAAYKRQQAEMAKAEEEERLREEEEARRKKRGGMQGFYKNVLERDEKRHEEAVKAAEEAKEKGPAAEEEVPKGKTEAEIAKELNAKGANVALNDEGQVVDKRQLLSSGLNINSRTKPLSAPSGPSLRRDPGRFSGSAGAQDRGRTSRARETASLEDQLLAASKHAFDDSDKDNQEQRRPSKSQKIEGDVLNAKK
ncbi:MAG: hypothetical protein M1824_002115 [Vezdaea acicularis]|nr:MAG: hypothetical protein M1824_002115 [Vezdaea acicularis]